MKSTLVTASLLTLLAAVTGLVASEIAYGQANAAPSASTPSFVDVAAVCLLGK